MPAKKDDKDKDKAEEMDPKAKADDKPESPSMLDEMKAVFSPKDDHDDEKPKAKPDPKPKVEAAGHFDDLTDGKPAEPKAAGAPDADVPAAEPDPAPEAPQERIEDLLKDKTFDPQGKVRTRLAKMLIDGQEFAPADLVAMGR